MHADEYRRFTAELVARAEADPQVIGLVAVGSASAVTHDPAAWSDHEAFLVVRSAEATRLLADPHWLPDADRFVVWHCETADGRGPCLDNLDPYRRMEAAHIRRSRTGSPRPSTSRSLSLSRRC